VRNRLQLNEIEKRVVLARFGSGCASRIAG